MKKVSIIICALALGFTSCKKFLDVNTTPNNPTSVPPSTLLTTTTTGMAFANANDLNRATSAIMQHIAGVANQTAAYDVYALDGAFDNQWNGEIYGTTLQNLQVLIDQYSNSSPAYSGIAKIEMAYVYSMAADIWGDVPYSQAAQGLKYENPRFDKVQDIYQGNATLNITSLFDLVKSGLADLAKPNNVLKPGSKDDLIYGGDLTKWTRAGNTLLLKFAIMLTNVNPTLAQSTISSVLTSGQYINSNTLDFEVPFGSSVGNRNPIFDFNNNLRQSDQMLSSRLLALCQSLNDTVRLAKYFTKPTGSFVAFNNGSTAAVPSLATRSKYNIYLTGAAGGEAPIRLLTNFQVNFILAEAALVLGTSGDPNAYYQAGITANMQKIGMTATEINTYFTNNPTVVTLSGTTQQKLQQIITQKYIAWIGNGIEAFDDYRRTGYPVLALPLNAVGDNPNVVPTRLPYTPNELARNPNAPNPRPKTDVKLWWAK
ncbi:MAG: SusD/RagB family nutrient-binding outer membrane lipoprotein [Bacteroidetes bacterium]|nr:SusD/RagB family nutrient-binding outer membrane lipoprotein [Bacteroidota bacterium]